MNDTPAAAPRRFPGVPRALAALSIALGLVLALLMFQDLVSRGPVARSPGLGLRLAAASAALNLGYVAAPLLIGRGPWRGFAAGLLLAPCLLGWLLMFWPGLTASPLLALLGGLSGLVLLALYALVLRQFAAEFADRRTGGPSGG